MDNNKLIAEFMDHGFHKGKHRSLDELQYHTSWDWLMPVVEKIMWDNDIEDNQCTNIEQALCDAKIDRVYDSVVEFIKEQKTYPFEEGDDYWVEEDGDLVWGVWDDASEEMHDENPNRQYFTQEEVIDHVKTYGVKLYKQ